MTATPEPVPVADPAAVDPDRLPVLAIFERLGWAHDVRWPTPRRLARLAARR